MKKLIAGLLIAAFTFTLCYAATPEKKAEKSAKQWLELVDNKNYAQSYDEAASFFKAMVDKNSWIQTCGRLRDMLGEVQSRKLISATRETRMSGAPDGEYIVLVFKTTFRKKADAQEIIVPMLDSDGKWRVSGYHID